jgi:general secretion pathway protein K
MTDPRGSIPSRDRKGAVAQRGSALLAVLWLMAALSAIAFTVANTVRAETERTSTDIDALRAYYLATGSIDRALLWIEWGPHPDANNKPRFFESPMPVLRFAYPTGEAIAEIIPETAKLNVNTATGLELDALMIILGAPADQAQVSGTAGGSFTEFDQYYLSLTPSFRSAHASFQQIEELLLVRGVTPALFYGSYTPDAQGRLVPHAGLRDCLSVYGTTGGLDVNTVEPAVMQAIGIAPEVVAGIVAARNALPIRDMGQLSAFNGSPGFGRLGVAPASIATLRATARLRLPNGQFSDLRRTVSALVKFLGPEWNPRYHVMRWYDNAYSIR